MSGGLRQQLAGADNHDGPRLGLYARAFWHLDNPSALAPTGRSRVGRQPFENKNVGAWLQTLAELNKAQRERRGRAVSCIEKALCIQTGTQSVERFLGELAMTERKNRAQHLTDFNIESAIKLNLQSMRGARMPKKFDPEELFASRQASLQRQPAPVLFKASSYGLACQNAYRNFYGERVLQSRSLEAQHPARLDKPHLGCLREGTEANTIEKERQKHRAAVGAVIAKAGASTSWDDLISAQSDMASHRDAASGNPGPSSAGDRPSL